MADADRDCITADKVLLVGGPFDGAIIDFEVARAVCMHDPTGERPDSLYAFNIGFDITPGRESVVIRSATYVGPGPARPADA